MLLELDELELEEELLDELELLLEDWLELELLGMLGMLLELEEGDGMDGKLALDEL